MVNDTTMSRYMFNSRKRDKDESLSSYVAALRQLSEFCEFGDTLSDMLHDRLVLGANHEKHQQRLLSEPDLTYAKSLEIACTMEATEKDTQEPVLFMENNSRRRGHRGSAPQNPTPHHVPSHQKTTCYRCRGNHLASSCRFIKAECQACHKKGHIARACRSKSQQQKGSQGQPRPRDRALYTGEANTNPPEPADTAYTMFTVRDPSTPPFTAKVELCGQKIRMEIDTGSAQSITSEQMYNDLVKAGCQLSLENMDSKLITCTGECLPVLGQVMVDVCINQQSARLALVVVKGEGPSLIGRIWLMKLKFDWSQVNKIDGTSDCELDQICPSILPFSRDIKEF